MSQQKARHVLSVTLLLFAAFAAATTASATETTTSTPTPTPTRPKTLTEQKIDQAWIDSGFGINELIKLRKKDCHEDLESFKACLAGLFNMYARINEKFLLIHPSLLSYGQIQVIKIEGSVGPFWLIRGNKLDSHKSDWKSFLNGIRLFVQRQQSSYDQLYQDKTAIDFEMMFRDVERRAQIAKVHPNLTVGEFLNGYLQFLDIRSRLMPKDAYDFVASQIAEADFESGIETVFVDGKWIISSTTGPSTKAGLRQGDQILAINEKSLIGESISGALQVSADARAYSNPSTYKIRRQNQEFNVSLLREVVTTPLLQSQQLLDQERRPVGYIKLSAFREGISCPMVADALNAHLKAGDRMIMDLRGNGGGEVSDLVCIATLLLGENKPVVETEKSLVTSYDEYVYTHKELKALSPEALESFRKLKLVFIQDQESASGSEILIGAMRHHRKALSVGRLSYGKGTWQDGQFWTPAEIPTMFMRFATAGSFYIADTKLTPDNVGVEPDFDVPWKWGGDQDDEPSFNQAMLTLINGQLPLIQNPPISSIEPDRVAKIKSCIDFEWLKAKQQKEFGTAAGFDYRLAYATEVARCL